MLGPGKSTLDGPYFPGQPRRPGSTSSGTSLTTAEAVPASPLPRLEAFQVGWERSWPEHPAGGWGWEGYYMEGKAPVRPRRKYFSSKTKAVISPSRAAPGVGA